MTPRKKPDEFDKALVSLVKVLPPIVPGSVIVVRLQSTETDAINRLREGLMSHYGHSDFLVVILGIYETIDVIPAYEIENWAESRRGYFGSAGKKFNRFEDL